MSKLFVDEIVHQSSQGSGTITLGASGETITTASGAKFSGITGQNYPAFEADLTADQSSVGDNVVTKVQFDTEIFDTDNCYDNSTNYRFTPTVSGKYFIYSTVRIDSSTVDKLLNMQIYIYKNGSELNNVRFNFGASALSFRNTGSIFTTTQLNGTSDYIEIYAKGDVTSGNTNIKENGTVFGAYRIGA